MPAPLPPVFIVGTGRCGSTLLSRFLRMHPGILSLSELFVMVTDLGGRIAETFPSGKLDGPALWRILSGIHPRQTLMLRQDVMMDEALYRPGPGRRFTQETGIPAIAATPLAHLSDDPDTLFDEVAALAHAQPSLPTGQAYATLFDTMRARRGAGLGRTLGRRAAACGAPAGTFPRGALRPHRARRPRHSPVHEPAPGFPDGAGRRRDDRVPGRRSV